MEHERARALLKAKRARVQELLSSMASTEVDDLRGQRSPETLATGANGSPPRALMPSLRMTCSKDWQRSTGPSDGSRREPMATRSGVGVPFRTTASKPTQPPS